jgi:hypothetical protein
VEETRFADLMFVLDRKRRRLADGAACAQCRERNPLSLIDARTPTMCRECDLRRRGLEPFEEHHLGGRPGERTILVPANPHAVLTFLQAIWREVAEPGSSTAYLFDLLLVHALGPSLGITLP